MIAVTYAIAGSGHESREGFVRDLRHKIPQAHLVPDPGGPPSSWRCERLAWLESFAWPDFNGRWHVVLEDDCVVPRDFTLLAEAALAAVRLPHAVISFYSSTRAIEEALQAGKHWARQRGPFYNSQAVAMPTDLIDAFVKYGDSDRFAEQPLSGTDWRIREFASAVGLPIFLTAPSLVEHGAPTDSLLPRHGGGRRRARRYVGDHHQPIDWTRGQP